MKIIKHAELLEVPTNVHTFIYPSVGGCPQSEDVVPIININGDNYGFSKKALKILVPLVNEIINEQVNSMKLQVELDDNRAMIENASVWERLVYFITGELNHE